MQHESEPFEEEDLRVEPDELCISSPGLPDHVALRAFLSVNAGTVLYALSALSILYGIARVFGALLANDYGLREALPCIWALNGYELALLGVLVLVVVRCRVFDEAVSLSVLVALFLVVSAVVLGIFANRGPELAMWAGATALVLACGKVYALHRWIRIPFGRGLTAGLLILLAWNFLAAPFLARHFAGEVAMDSHERLPWLWTWPGLLAGSAAVLAGLAFARTDPGTPSEDTVPFIRRTQMTIVLTLIVLVGGAVNSYVLAYMWDMTCVAGDFMPLATIILFVGLELIRRMRRPEPGVEAILYGLPLLTWGHLLLMGHVEAGPGWGPGLLLYPPVALGLTAVFLVVASRHRRQPELLYTASAYGVATLLTAGWVPGDLGTLNWRLVGLLVAVTALVAGCLRRNAYLCWVSVICLTVGVGLLGPVQSFCGEQGLPLAAVVLVAYGLGTLAVYLVFVPGLASWIPQTATGFLLVGTGALMLDAALWGTMLAASLAMVLAVAVYFRRRDWIVVALLVVTAVFGAHLATARLVHWRYIALGFILLAAGAAASLRKAGRLQTETTPPVIPPVDLQ